MKTLIVSSLAMLLVVGFSGISSAEKPPEAAYVGNGVIYYYTGASATLGITTNGNLKQFIVPPGGCDHIFNEGYGLCYGPTTGNENVAYDTYGNDANIALQPLPSTVECPGVGPGGTNISPDGNGCANYPYRTTVGTAPTVTPLMPLNVIYYTKTADNVLRIRNQFQWDGVSDTVRVTTTVRNISGAGVLATLKRYADFDGNCSVTDWAGKTYDAYFSWDETGRFLELRAASHIPSLVDLDLYSSDNFSTCPTATTGLSTNSGDNTATLEWSLGTLAPGQEATRVVNFSAVGL